MLYCAFHIQTVSLLFCFFFSSQTKPFATRFACILKTSYLCIVFTIFRSSIVSIFQVLLGIQPNHIVLTQSELQGFICVFRFIIHIPWIVDLILSHTMSGVIETWMCVYSLIACVIFRSWKECKYLATWTSGYFPPFMTDTFLHWVVCFSTGKFWFCSYLLSCGVWLPWFRLLLFHLLWRCCCWREWWRLNYIRR